MEGDHLYSCFMPIHATPRAVSLLVFDPLQYFSWWVYGGVVVAYTALVFHGELSKEDGPLIFSKRNARSFSGIISVHLVFLAILLGLMWIGVWIYPSLPSWMTEMFNSRGSAHSPADILYIFAMIAMHYVERRYLYVKSATDHHDGKGTSAQSSTTKRKC
jgi:hypothetical protein